MSGGTSSHYAYHREDSAGNAGGTGVRWEQQYAGGGGVASSSHCVRVDEECDEGDPASPDQSVRGNLMMVL